MPQILQTRDLALGELLAGPDRFHIPSYQREYAWERKHARELLEDIVLASREVEQTRRAEPYFLGSVLVCRQPPSEGGTQHPQLDVVDGQQRLITLTMMAACLRDMLKGATVAKLHGWIVAGDVLRVTLRAADAPLLQSAVQQLGATRKAPPDLADEASMTHVNMVENRAELVRGLQRLTPAERERLATFLADQCRVVLITADDFDYAYQIFLSINERGKELTVEDIFQAQLLGPLGEDQQRRYAPIIGQVGKYRRENERHVSRGKTFFSHIAFAHGWSGRTIVKSIRDAIRATGGPRPFADKIFVPMADAYLVLCGLEAPAIALSEPAAQALEHLQMLEAHGDDDWVATAMLVWNRLSTDTAQLGQILVRLDRFAHLLMALGCGGAARKGKYGPINRAIIEGEPWSRIGEMLSVSKADERIALRNIAQQLHIMDKTSCRLFLFRLDAHLSGRPLASYRALPNYAYQSDNAFTVEHLLPQGKTVKGPMRERWTAHYRDDRHRQACAQYLGNLTLVTDAENKELGQLPFAEKQRILLARGTHPIHMTEALRSVGDWTPADLLQRHEQLMAAAQAVWQLEGIYPRPPAAPTPK